jgi:hypothetical protein
MPKNIADLLVGGSAEEDENELELASNDTNEEDDSDDDEATEETSEDSGRQGDERDVPDQTAGRSKPEEEVNDQAEVKPQAKVDYGALHEERRRRQELQAQNEAMEKTYQALLQRLNATEPEPEIDYQDDPAGYIRQQQAKLERQVVELNQHREQQAKEAAALQQQRQLAEAVSADEARYSQSQPDYNDRVSAALQTRMTQLQQFGFSAAEAQHTVREEVQFLVSKALNSERSPAEALYAMARAMTPAPQQKPAVVKPNPMAAAAQASKSLSRAGTASTQSETSLKRLASLQGAEFDAEFEKLFPKSKKTSRIARPQ